MRNGTAFGCRSFLLRLFHRRRLFAPTPLPMCHGLSSCMSIRVDCVLWGCNIILGLPICQWHVNIWFSFGSLANFFADFEVIQSVYHLMQNQLQLYRNIHVKRKPIVIITMYNKEHPHVDSSGDQERWTRCYFPPPESTRMLLPF